jgi:hypothetical protein
MVIHDDDNSKLAELIEVILNMDRSQLLRLRNILAHSTPQTQLTNNNVHSLLKEGSKDKDKQQLVGMLPYVLLDKKYFPTNDLLALFAKNNLKITIRHYEKRSRNEILGTIIAEVVEKEPEQIALFIKALNKILGKDKKGEVSNFFLEWDRVIRET